MHEIATTIAAQNGVSAKLVYDKAYPVLVNDEDAATFAADVAESLVSSANVDRAMAPIMGSEDFAYMLESKKGAYILIGNSGTEKSGCMVHNPNYDFNDDILELGARYWVSITETYLQP